MKWFEAERRKLEGMTAGKRMEYIWQYYKLWIVGILSLTMLAVYLGHGIANSVHQNHLYVLFVNTYADLGDGSAFWKGYAKEIDTRKENVIFDTGNFFDMENTTGNHYYEKAVVLLDGGIADAVVMDTEGLCALGAGGRLMDWADPRLDALRERYADRLLTVSVSEADSPVREVIVGVDLSDCRLVSEDHAYTDCALGISAEAQHLDAVGQFMEYLFPKEVM